MNHFIKQKIFAFKLEILCLIGIIGVSLFLRFWNLDGIGLGGDESVYSGQALLLLGNEEMARYFVLVSRGTTNFLFHQVLQALVFFLFGFSDFTARALSATFSLATVLLVFFIGFKLFGKWVGLLSAIFMAINGYAVITARVALLDSTMTFMFTLSMLFLSKWIITSNNKWAYALASSTALAIAAKVPAFLIIPIALITLIFSKKLKLLASRRVIVLSFIVFSLSITPVILQIIYNFDVYNEFFKEGSARVINVRPTYYIDKALQYGGIFFIFSAIIGVGVSLFIRRDGDIQCLVWIVIVGAFLQLTPIKGWNYWLPILPALSILSARGLIFCITMFKQQLSLLKTKGKIKVGIFSLKVSLGVICIMLIVLTSHSSLFKSLNYIFYERPFAGVKEAAYWIKENAPPDSKVMTISYGSAQYIFGLYADVGAYPFGSFGLHTLLPNGTLIAGPPDPDPLIESQEVKYLVFYLSEGDQGDDPFHELAKTQTEQNFLELVQKYDGQTRHVIYDEYKGLYGETIRNPRVWIFEVGKILPVPSIYVTNHQNGADIRGTGFLINSPVKIIYVEHEIKKVITNHKGEFFTSVNLTSLPCGYELMVSDEAKNNQTSIIPCAGTS